MSAGKSQPKFLFATLALTIGFSGAARAEEIATVLAPPAARLGAVAPCRIVRPTFEPKAASREIVTPARYPGGAKLTLPVAAPCPATARAVDL